MFETHFTFLAALLSRALGVFAHNGFEAYYVEERQAASERVAGLVAALRLSAPAFLALLAAGVGDRKETPWALERVAVAL